MSSQPSETRLTVTASSGPAGAGRPTQISSSCYGQQGSLLRADAGPGGRASSSHTGRAAGSDGTSLPAVAAAEPASDSSYFKYFKQELGIPTGDRLGVTVTSHWQSRCGRGHGLTAESVSVMDREPAGRATGRAGRRETFHHNERVRVSKDPGLPGSLLTDGAGPGGLPTRSQSLSKMLR